ncbi:hypothetical protein L7F22_015530 [Adiantum nelumboides]|nr:hypothetical protein [Adiantum nelumboides]
MFWKALLPVTSYRFVPLTEQIEKYCCGLPKGLRKYCTKTKVTTLTQLIEVANTGNGLLKGKDCEFNTGIKEGPTKKNSAKKYVLKEVPKATHELAKVWKGKATAEPAKGPTKKWKRPFPCKSEEQRQVLRSENKCFICEQPCHIAQNCPQKKRPADSEDKEDRKGKRPMSGLVLDMVGDKPSSDASELCRAWVLIPEAVVRYLSHNYHKNKSSTTIMEMLFARLCGWCRNSEEKAMQEEIYALEEYLKHIQKEKEYLATQNNKLQAALQKAEDTIKRSDQKTASLREKLEHEIKMLQAKGDELLEQSDGDAYIIPSLFKNLRSDYKRLHEEDLKTLLQARLSDKSMKLS